jgi:omega-6 fatty acid desaturase (delta-12 desaturase)
MCKSSVTLHNTPLLTQFNSVWDFFLLAVIYKGTKLAEAKLAELEYPHPALAPLAWYSLWALYSYASGLVATGLWVIAHGT